MTTVDLDKLERDVNQMSADISDMLGVYACNLDDVRERPDDFGVCEDVRDSALDDLAEAVDELRDADREARTLSELTARARSETSSTNKVTTSSAAVAHTLEQSLRVVESVRDALDGAETCFSSVERSARENTLTSDALKKLDDLASDVNGVSSRLREAETRASEIARSCRIDK